MLRSVASQFCATRNGRTAREASRYAFDHSPSLVFLLFYLGLFPCLLTIPTLFPTPFLCLFWAGGSDVPTLCRSS